MLSARCVLHSGVTFSTRTRTHTRKKKNHLEAVLLYFSWQEYSTFCAINVPLLFYSRPTQIKGKFSSRSKSEYDLSTLRQLQEEKDDEISGEEERTTSQECQPVQTACSGRQESASETTASTATPAAAGVAGTRDRQQKINSTADREDERKIVFTPCSRPDPMPPETGSTATKPERPPPPAVYTAKPVYINLSSSTAIPSQTTSKGNTISVLTTSQKAACIMSEESSDKTPTNPTGGEVDQVGELSVSDCLDARGNRGTFIGFSGIDSPPIGTGPRGSLQLGEAGCSGSNYPVPRSFSDISCHHSRAGSDVSSETSRTSRTSRASASANLEKFFNEMGMEKDILDPMLQLQQRRAASELDIFESVSSLDSHDARSICSALSRSEKEISDAEAFERNQQQTSVVERNARIIKWLCSVKKAKQNPGFTSSAS